MSFDPCGILGKSPALTQLFKILEKVAPTDTTVLVTGESGTGKELLVRALHKNSPRHKGPFVPVNCGAIPKELLESELFGHEKGAFTHAIRSRPGRFELANGGTIFLNEIGELDLSLQVKILRVIQEKEFERVGGTQTKKVDVRIVAATNRNLEEEVKKGNFEKIYLPPKCNPHRTSPLRERGEDILLLANFFLEKFCTLKNRPPLSFSPEVKELLLNYSWPGNVRELENFMERISILCENERVEIEDLPEKILKEQGLNQPKPKKPEAFTFPSLQDMLQLKMDLKTFLETIENKLITEALEESKGVKNKAANILGIKRTTLIEKIKKKEL